MPYRLKCTRCGRWMDVALTDSGQRVMCHACGAAQTVTKDLPALAYEPPRPPATDSSTPPAADDDPVLIPELMVLHPARMSNGASVPAGKAVVSPRRPGKSAEKPDRTLYWTFSLLACLFSCAIGVFATTWFFQNRKSQQAPKSLGDPQTQPADAIAVAANLSDPPAIVHPGATPDPIETSQPRVAVTPITRPVPIAVKPPPKDPMPPKAVDNTQRTTTIPSVAIQTRTNPNPPAQTRPTVNPPLRVDPPIVRRPLLPARPPARSSEPPSEQLTDDMIGTAIRRGADFLLTQFGDGSCIAGSGRRAGNEQYPGVNALCVYALIQCGQATNDERLNVRSKRMKAMIDTMRDMPITDSYSTYIRGIRATALAVYNRPEDRAALREDVNLLIRASRHGAYSYGERSAQTTWDNSNSQYGLLGVWSGAEVGAEVPQSLWLQVQNHWYECQNVAGDWGYQRASGGGTLSMTVAGLASLFVTHDYLEAPQLGSIVGREPFSKPLSRGLAWLENGDNCIRNAIGGYTMYGIERVGLASGFKYFGSHDWYRELAADLIRKQQPDGSWSGGHGIGSGQLTETAYNLLFLARGRHPILMNKLRFEGFWANRPRDVANLARFASRELERPLNWQVVPLDRNWTHWLDSPVLYLASHQPVNLDADNISNLRKFVEAGGMIFTQADGDSESFNAFVADLARQLFPAYEMADLPQDHEIYWLHYRLQDRPKLRYVGNGSRIFLLHSPQDLTMAWQARAERTRRPAFELGVNMFLYAAGKTDLRNRLASPYIPQPRFRQAKYHVPFARLKYAGAWDPEPAAFERFSLWFEYRTGYTLDVSEIEIADLHPRSTPIAHLTGVAPFSLTPQQIDALRQFVNDGGTLIVDSCGGSASFNQFVAGTLLPKLSPTIAPQVLAPDHPILVGQASGMEFLTRPQVRTIAEQRMGRGAGSLRSVKLGQGHVLYSPLDITTGLLGTSTWGVIGYQSPFAQGLLKNIILWAADGGHDTAQ